MPIQLSDADLLARLAVSEDPFVERKTAGDVNDVLKVAVSFANSLPRDVPGVIFLNVRDGGAIQPDVDLDQLQKKATERLNRAYPPLPVLFKILVKDRLQVLCLIVWGSSDTPHFAGPAYVRTGSQSIEASASQFKGLVARRLSQVAEILQWLGQEVTIEHIRSNANGFVSRSSGQAQVVIDGCNQFYVTLRFPDHLQSVTLDRVFLGYDHGRNRLLLELRQ